MIDTTKLRSDLRVDEDARRFPYIDTKGKTSIGVGRNLTDRGLSDDEIEYLLTNDIVHVTGVLDGLVPWWNTLDEVRARVLANMAFNMGPYFILHWPIFAEQLRTHDFVGAANNMAHTKWAKDVGDAGPSPAFPNGQRAWRLIAMMRNGVEPSTRQG